MKILIVGLGSIGRRHIKNLKAVDPSLDVAVLRQRSKSSDLGDVGGLVSRAFFTQEQALAWGPQVAVIANPAPFHISAAMRFAQAGAHLFIEKPLSVSLDGIEALAKVCRDKRLTAMVGYVLRFSLPLIALKKALDEKIAGRVLSVQASVGRYLPQWRPESDYQDNVSARRELGGGVVLELSHELDYVRWLAGEVREVNAMAAHVSDLSIDVEDVAEIHLRHEGGVISHIHLDMLDRAAQRSCRMIGSEGTLTWESDGACHRVRLFDGNNGQWRTLYEAEGLDTNVMHLAQWRHFFDCIRSGTKPLGDLYEGRRTLEVALEVLRK